ncbi:hypothetical protein AV530_015560 [Patagioenas fasciata monilis]|uniref:Uncharacterized protein n=1 Tax=Patagioenas fasciata monilis TaxID=372326 RepID=A0A1V4KHZ9_PATFA|nr:hypothetical protein AV530_015560 [Patagioenas fasciata monilis]
MLRENQTSPFRNAIPANTSSLGAYSAHGNRVLGEPAHGECKTVLITKTSWGFRFPVPKYLRISTSVFKQKPKCLQKNKGKEPLRIEQQKNQELRASQKTTLQWANTTTRIEEVKGEAGAI